mgnify:CR=1 FL=1
MGPLIRQIKRLRIYAYGDPTSDLPEIAKHHPEVEHLSLNVVVRQKHNELYIDQEFIDRVCSFPNLKSLAGDWDEICSAYTEIKSMPSLPKLEDLAGSFLAFMDDDNRFHFIEAAPKLKTVYFQLDYLKRMFTFPTGI